MLYFTNVRLAKRSGVSEGTVRKWIEKARAGEVELELHEHDGTFHVANTVKNLRSVELLASRSKQQTKNHFRRKTVQPTSEFYELYDQAQISDIISNLEIYREVPKQYSYFGPGAKRWDTYARRLWDEDEENTLTATIELLRSNVSNIVRLLDGYDRINVVDIGVGNALPVKDLLTNLLYDYGLLGRYLAIDISKDMLEIAESNIKEWFAGEISFEGYLRDVTYQRFGDLLQNESQSNAANLVLLLGGTSENLRSPDEIFQVVHHSMGHNDLLVTSTKLDSEDARLYFDFHTQEDRAKLPLDRRLMLARLGIDESLYEGEQGFDPTHRIRFNQARLKVDVAIEFEVDGRRRIVSMNKGDAIVLWLGRHITSEDAVNQLERSGFSLRGLSTTDDENFLLTLSRLGRSMHSGFRAANQ